MDLARALAAAPQVKWLIGRVTSLSGTTFTMTYRGGIVEGVAALDHYNPQVGDVVHVLASDLNGMIAIGSNNQPAVLPTPPVPGAPFTRAATTTATYQISTGTWVTGMLQASPDHLALWLYPTFSGGPSATAPMAQFTIRITALSDIPLEFILHASTTTGGVPEILATSYRIAAPPIGIVTDVPLPLEWATEILRGRAQGIGVGAGDYSLTLTGSSGLLTFTPLL